MRDRMSVKESGGPLPSVARVASRFIEAEYADPATDEDPKIRRLYEEVEAFLYPPWKDGSGGRGDISGDEHDLMYFYQGRLNRDDWVVIPGLLERTRRRTDAEYERSKRQVLDAIRQNGGSITVQAIRKMRPPVYQSVLDRMVHEGVLDLDRYFEHGTYTAL